MADQLTFKALAHVKKYDAVNRIMYAGVYAANKIDTDDEMMVQWDITNAAHEFLTKKDLDSVMDTNHDGIPNGCVPVESFVARKGDPDFQEGEWVVASKLTPEMAQKYDDGEVNGYSFEGIVFKVDAEVDLKFYRDNITVTSKSQEHDHIIYVIKDAVTGKISKGITDVVDGHYHEANKGTATGEAIYLETTKDDNIVRKKHSH